MDYRFRFSFMLTDGKVNKLVDVYRLTNLLPKCALCAGRSFIVGLDVGKEPAVSFICKDCGIVYNVLLSEIDFDAKLIEYEIVKRLKEQNKEFEKLVRR